MFSASIETIWFIREPSSTMLSGNAVSKPPSVALRPVRGTTFMRLAFA